MSWNVPVPAASESKYELTPEGSHQAALAAIVDLGTQQAGFGDEVDLRHQVYLVWELTDCPLSDRTRNHTIGKVYTLSLHEKANLRQTIEAWRGKKFEPSESFDLKKMLGAHCALTVMHKRTNSGKDVTEVKGVAPLMKGVPQVKGKLTAFMWKLGDGEVPTHEWLPRIFGKVVADKIRECDELKNKPAPAPGQPAGATAAPNGTSDEAPF